MKQNQNEAKIYHQKDRIIVKSDDYDFQRKIQDMVASFKDNSLRLPWGETIETEKETIVRDGYRTISKKDKNYLHALAMGIYDYKNELDIELYITDNRGKVHPYHPLRYFLEEKKP